ncbi:MAG: phytoene desaturase family protein [Planctomycetota bacterium]
MSEGTTNGSERHVVVVGGGLAGLASAVELVSHGCRVTLVERNEHLGGKMNVLEEGGYRFDMGPTILTLPQVLRGIVRRSGRNVPDYIDLVELDPQWRCMFEDGTVVDLLRDVNEFARAIDAQFPDEKPGEGYKKFIEYSRRMYRLSESVFFFQDLGSVFDMMKSPPSDPQVLNDVLAMRMHSTVGATAHKHIKQPHVAQIVEHFLQYVGSSPFLSPAILSLIAAAQVDHGCWYSMGGTRMVAKSLERILREEAERGRVEIVKGTGVGRIEVDDAGRATGVTLQDGRRIDADAVVSNCDVQRTYRDLVGNDAANSEQRSIAKKYTPACSGLVLYLGLDRQYEHLAHHNFLFSKNSHDEFGDIYKRGVPARDPSLYIAAPSRTDREQAPEGGEALYILIHTPYKRANQTWEGPGGLLESYRPVVIDKLKRFGMEDIEEHIVVEKHLTPDGIEHMYNAEGGAIYGLASHGKLHGGFKPKNRSAVDSLYLAGGSANPGPGVPMVLMSGVTAALCVCEDLDLDHPGVEMGHGREDAMVEAKPAGHALAGM